MPRRFNTQQNFLLKSISVACRTASTETTNQNQVDELKAQIAALRAEMQNQGENRKGGLKNLYRETVSEEREKKFMKELKIGLPIMWDLFSFTLKLSCGFAAYCGITDVGFDPFVLWYPEEKEK
jgi:hypothetical protein